MPETPEYTAVSSPNTDNLHKNGQSHFHAARYRASHLTNA